ncbi:MAG: hypothetical protein K2M87_05125 [Muribaculaceae bacterium]|nr:hypothetical protein [Muribaculaceae bacterium]
MNGLNGIIISGKIYEAVWTTERSFDCHQCHLNEICYDHAHDFCNDFVKVVDDPKQREDSFPYFRFSQELTDKINSNGK